MMTFSREHKSSAFFFNAIIGTFIKLLNQHLFIRLAFKIKFQTDVDLTDQLLVHHILKYLFTEIL